jgi:hypothetical protein
MAPSEVLETVADGSAPRDARTTAALSSWLERPLSAWWCALGWLASTAIFVAIVQLLGGPSNGDASFTSGSTWAIAHGQFTCAFPRSAISVAPLYPMLSGALAATTRLGHATAFPSGAALGPSCDRALRAFNAWSSRAGTLTDTLRIGYVGWIILLVGVVAVLRACGRGRCCWEPATLAVVACLAPVWMCVESYFHPQDLVAMGLALVSLACARRNRWIGAGILIALAVLSQQFAVLVAVPLLVVAPPLRRPHFALAALATALLASLPLIIASSGQAARDVLMGTGDSTLNDGTLVAELHLGGASLFALSRLAPLVLSLLLGIWVVHRLGRAAALEPTALVALVALSLSLRLLFETSLYGYYLMALAVTLVLLDVVQGRFRPALVVWLVVVSLACLVGPNSQPVFWLRPSWGVTVRHVLPPAVLVLAVVFIGAAFLARGLHRKLFVWIALATAAVFAWTSADEAFWSPFVAVSWQVVLVLSGIALAAGPLYGRLREPVECLQRDSRGADRMAPQAV